jgi:C1A family cysteine protease
MKTFAAVAMIGVASAMSEIESAFLGWITEHGKSYTSMEEYGFRLSQFVRAHNEIMTHNESSASFKLGHNTMSDWTEAEYKALLTYQPMEEHMLNVEYHPETVQASGEIDWRSYNGYSYVQPVKNQASCGSCWTFSAVACMENHWAIKTGKLYSLSEQQLVDCDTQCYGCNGGVQAYAFQYYKSYYAHSEETYSYKAKEGTCKYNSYTPTDVKTKGWTGYTNVTANNESQMKAALQKGVLAVAIQADQSSFQRYRTGIFDSASCGTQLDHATNVVGWGSEAGQEYWIMRNSWGTTWGEQGYMRLAIQSGAGVCGIQMQPLYPTV